MYQTRRNKLLSELPEYSITVLHSGKAPYSIGDEKYPFKVNRSFYYYTGLDYENLYLVLLKLPGQEKEMIFIEPFDEMMAKWVGGKVRAPEVKETSGINDVRFTDELLDSIGSLINNYGKLGTFTLCGDLSKEEIGQYNEVIELFRNIKKKQLDVNIKNIYREICLQRMCKDHQEIENIKKALSVTKEGIELMMKMSHEIIWENELEAYFDYTLKCHQCDHAFGSIVATGKNATILHYMKNNQCSKTGDMVLCDLGAAYGKYSSDITRTFPVGGHFSDRQKQIYDIVLRANKMIASIAKPGLTTKQLNDRVIEFYQQELDKIGLLTNGKTVRDYYWHGVSHTIGLETHDVNMPNEPLKIGCVISDEPGLYLEEEGIGIRIEDDLLITENGCEVLSKDIIKEVDEIEAFMNKKD